MSVSVATKPYVDPSVVTEVCEESYTGRDRFGSFGHAVYPDVVVSTKAEWNKVVVDDVAVVLFSVVGSRGQKDHAVHIRVEVPCTIVGRSSAKVVYARMAVPVSAKRTTFDVVAEYQGARVNDQRRGNILKTIRKILTDHDVDPMISIIVAIGTT